MKLDIIAFGAHPDDIELGCAGTLLSHIDQGKKVGMIDLTMGELGTRGNKKIRSEESMKAAEILGVTVRENMHFKDSFFSNDHYHQLEIIKIIRNYKPDVVLTTSLHDRHPDHIKAGQLVPDACFFSGLGKIKTIWKGKVQDPWRPVNIFHYIQFLDIKPHFIVDVSNYHHKKMDAIKAHKSQFYNPNSAEPETLISRKDFLDFIEAKALIFGKQIGVSYGEGYTSNRYPGIKSLFDLL